MSSYDQNLLDEAPKATRAQLQEGYSVDLLEQPPRRSPSTRNQPAQTPQSASATVPLAPGFIENGSGEKFGSPTHTSTAPKPRTSFWRTRNGIITIVVVAIIVIGAVVGGAVGGTVKESSNNSVNTTGTGTSSSQLSFPLNLTTITSAASQGVGENRPTTSSTTDTTTTSGNLNIGKRFARQTAAP